VAHGHPKYLEATARYKSLFRFVGTLVGASLGVWLVSDYLSAPVFFLSVTFLVMCFASYKVEHLGPTIAPYAYLLTGLTLITIESSGLTHPDKAWFVALSRTEEIFVGIIAVLIITPLFGLRCPRLEFQQLASSAVDQLKNLTNAELQNMREGTSSNSELVMAYEALKHYSHRSMNFRFVSNVDGTDFAETVEGLDPAETELHWHSTS
jgi:uncharacterized membrane protein YccC